MPYLRSLSHIPFTHLNQKPSPILRSGGFSISSSNSPFSEAWKLSSTLLNHNAGPHLHTRPLCRERSCQDALEVAFLLIHVLPSRYILSFCDLSTFSVISVPRGFREAQTRPREGKHGTKQSHVPFLCCSDDRSVFRLTRYLLMISGKV